MMTVNALNDLNRIAQKPGHLIDARAALQGEGGACVPQRVRRHVREPGLSAGVRKCSQFSTVRP